MPSDTPFPQDFVWGAGTSAYQIEGGLVEHGRGESVWDTFSRRPDAIRDGHTAERACEHVRRWRQDIELMRQIGLRSYRFSTSWPRVVPDGVGAISEAGLGFYDALVDGLLDAGVEPCVTLFHWDYPVALHKRGGWMHEASPQWFGDYAAIVVKRLGDRVRRWITINEPQVFIELGYGRSEHAPGLQLPLADRLVIAHHVMCAHGEAARAIRQGAPDSKIGWAPVAHCAIPATEDEADVEAARRATIASGGPTLSNSTWFNDPVFHGRYPEDGLDAHGRMLPAGWENDLEDIHEVPDFFGMNYYQAPTVRAGPDGQPQEIPDPQGAPRTAFGWPIKPEGLYWASRLLYQRYQAPILVTENGLSTHDGVALDGDVHDTQRIDYAARHLLALADAMRDGVPVEGYYHWSLLDNFEWAEGYHQRFGLVHVDFESQERMLKDSARWYQRVIQSSGAILREAPPLTVVPRKQSGVRQGVTE